MTVRTLNVHALVEYVTVCCHSDELHYCILTAGEMSLLSAQPKCIIRDGSLRPRCRHLANSTIHRLRVVSDYALLRENITSAAKPEVHKV